MSLDTKVEIGFNGSGDPICLEPMTGAVWYLNHDDGFRAVFVNSSAGQLAAYLLLFRALIEAASSSGEMTPTWMATYHQPHWIGQ